MRVKMRTLSAGPAGVRRPGDVVNVPDAEAEQLVRGGYAERLETAARKPPEQAAPAKGPAQETAAKKPPEQAAKGDGQAEESAPKKPTAKK